MSGAELIAAERQRQIDVEGYSLDHDRDHQPGELAVAADCYLRSNPSMWPWHIRYWKPTPDDRIRELIKAGALIAAEIDRLGAVP